LNLRRKYGKPDVILTYNLDTGYALAGYLIAKSWRIPVVPIVADLNLPEALKPTLRGYNARLQVALLKRMTGVVTFSSLTARDLRLAQPVIKVEPGVNAIDFLTLPSSEPGPRGRKIVMFSGTLVEASGILRLLQAFALVRDPNVELWITGRGNLQARIEEAGKQDSRIRFMGFVDRTELLRLHKHATVLINPRSPSLPEHRYNFPSKVLQYMATGRPVITTATGDVAEYESLVFLLHEETATAMARLISEVCALSAEEREARATQARAYVLQHKTWEVESRRIYEFLRQLVYG
jgi:glycosyltransferase involved in cell wall biosynthesis